MIRTFKPDGGWYEEYSDGSVLHLIGPSLRGSFHRVDGPAIEWANGTRQWFLNGQCYDNKMSEFQSNANITDDEMIVIHLKFGPL
jgi:hypothetical protein